MAFVINDSNKHIVNTTHSLTFSVSLFHCSTGLLSGGPSWRGRTPSLQICKYDTTVQLTVLLFKESSTGYILAISFEETELFKVSTSSMYLTVF